MEAIDRRDAVRTILRGVALGTVAFALIPNAAEAVPLALEKSLAEKVDRLIEEAQVIVVNPRRRRRHWTCWWRGGRRVCGWRWRW
jgi:predicted metallo-beta-lactamase superfamily hydrolase